MTHLATKTVGALALEIPGATRVFERLGIDYCCGGGRSLEVACSEAGINTAEVSLSMEQVQQGRPGQEDQRDWRQARLSELVDHIVSTHHVYTREELGRINPLLDKVCSVHGQNHPELLQIQKSFRALTQELTLHMQKEEQILFPFIKRMEQEVHARRPVSSPPFGSLQNPIRVMAMEHDAAGNALEAMRRASSNYLVPSDACISYQSLYQALPAIEADLHQHIHLENNLLFPRAISMECGV